MERRFLRTRHERSNRSTRPETYRGWYRERNDHPRESGGANGRVSNAYYDMPCRFVGPRGDDIRGGDEYVEIDALVATAQTLALTAID